MGIQQWLSGGQSSKGEGAAGFSLIEVLISLTVVTLYLAALSTIIQNGLDINGRTSLRAEAGSLAFKKVQDYINLDYDSIPIGDVLDAYEVEDFSAEAVSAKLQNAVAKIYVEPESVLQSATNTTTTNYSQTVAADAAYVSGSEINAVNVYDAGNIYWNEQRISDDSFSNYTYNAYSSGPDNKPLPSIDLGSARLVDTLRIEWWTCSYGANNFRIEAKNSAPTNNSGWTTIVSGLADNGIPCSSTESAAQDVDVSSNTTPYRYWRMYMVDGTDSQWNVLSEFEAFSAGVPGDIVEQHGADASSAPGDLYFSSSDLEMSEDGTRGHQSLGIIFDGADMAQGATIDDAYIEFTADETNADAVTLLVTGVDRDNAAAWSGSFAVDNAVDADSSDGSVGTSATVVWTPSAWTAGDKGANTRVNVKDIVQEIVNRAGWTADNNIAFAVQYVSGSGKRTAMRSPAPELVINWSETVTTTSTGNYVDDDGDGDVDNPTLVRVTAVIEYDAYGSRRRVEYATLIRKFGLGD